MGNFLEDSYKKLEVAKGRRMALWYDLGEAYRHQETDTITSLCDRIGNLCKYIKHLQEVIDEEEAKGE